MPASPPPYGAQPPNPYQGQAVPPGYPAAHGQRPGYPPQPGRPGVALGRVAGALLLVAAILAGIERLVFGGRYYFRTDFWLEIPLILILLAAVVSAVLLLIGLPSPALRTFAAAGAGMLLTSGLTAVIFNSRFSGVVSGVALLTLLSFLLNLAALVLAMVSAGKSGAATAPPPAQWTPPAPAPNAWGQPTPPQYPPH
ncbi:hypothetical protein [Nocardia sp. NPDC048505]|uniref:hypothetical protein n=1 Tax=unclassified Nocardia TaxID=2637762 RepID=UPI003405F56F